ncbi:hypothetical protein LMTR3_35770 [Bradyrhizobium sp. LMTR 3]|nr:hypothetical protein LMTR3_35770 [Bradyrhizobium sp. LMTR 3]
MFLLDQSVSYVRQKRLFVRLDRLANALSVRRPLFALWKAGHQPIQLILDFCPIPIGHRLPLPRIDNA